jgi:hypothetical protein
MRRTRGKGLADRLSEPFADVAECVAWCHRRNQHRRFDMNLTKPGATTQATPTGIVLTLASIKMRGPPGPVPRCQLTSPRCWNMLPEPQLEWRSPHPQWWKFSGS